MLMLLVVSIAMMQKHEGAAAKHILTLSVTMGVMLILYRELKLKLQCEILKKIDAIML